jgi:hypothetical protein
MVVTKHIVNQLAYFDDQWLAEFLIGLVANLFSSLYVSLQHANIFFTFLVIVSQPLRD